MEILFSLHDQAARATFLQSIMQSFHSTYICLWSYFPHPSKYFFYYFFLFPIFPFFFSFFYYSLIFLGILIYNFMFWLVVYWILMGCIERMMMMIRRSNAAVLWEVLNEGFLTSTPNWYLIWKTSKFIYLFFFFKKNY